MKRTLMGLFIMLVMTFSHAAFAVAASGCMDGPERRHLLRPHAPAPPIPDLLFLDVDLTEEQITAISRIRESFLKEILPLKARIAEKLSFLNKPGMEDSGQKRFQEWENLRSLKGTMHKKQMEYMQRALAILTPEQMKRLMPPPPPGPVFELAPPHHPPGMFPPGLGPCRNADGDADRVQNR